MDYKFEGDSIRKKLTDAGIYRPLDNYEPDPEDNKISVGYSYPIKAFEKFLGYYDSYYNIAYNPSISFNTDFSLIFSACRYNKNSGNDDVMLDGKPADKYMERYRKPLEFFRKNNNIKGSFSFYIKRYRKYSDAKGMSESSAVASAVSRSIVKNILGEGAGRDDSIVSRYARMVSGSGTRAAVNGPSIWLSYPGINENESYAVKIPADVTKINYAIFPANIDYQTTSAHSESVKSPFYNSWISEKYRRLSDIVSRGFNTEDLMERGLEDMFSLNSVLMSRGNIVQTPESLALLKIFLEFRKKNPGIYITGDTGPSLMVMSSDKRLLDEFLEISGGNYLKGGHNPDAHKKYMNEFRKEAEEYFSSLNQ